MVVGTKSLTSASAGKCEPRTPDLSRRPMCNAWWYLCLHSKRVIQSVPTELSADHMSVLNLLEVCRCCPAYRLSATQTHSHAMDVGGCWWTGRNLMRWLYARDPDIQRRRKLLLILAGQRGGFKMHWCAPDAPTLYATVKGLASCLYAMFSV